MSESVFLSPDPRTQAKLDQIAGLLKELNEPRVEANDRFLFAVVVAPNPMYHDSEATS